MYIIKTGCLIEAISRSFRAKKDRDLDNPFRKFQRVGHSELFFGRF